MTDSKLIREEVDIKNLLARMPKEVADSFSDTQLIHLKTVIGGRTWSKHAIDQRGTFQLPFMRWRYYYVFLMGRNRRQLSDREKRISALMMATFVFTFLAASTLLGLLMIYLLKSFLGIDIFPNFSLGIWDYFRDNVF